MTEWRTLIVSVARARVLLGSKYAAYSDEQIENLTIQLDGIAHAFISGSNNIVLENKSKVTKSNEGSK